MSGGGLPEARPVGDLPAGRAERNRVVFERAWALVNEKFYDPKFNGVDWPAARDRHQHAAIAAADDRALYKQINAMLAELRKSHNTAKSPADLRDAKAQLRLSCGLDTWPAGDARLVIQVVPGSPAEEAGVRVGWTMVRAEALGSAQNPAPGDRVRYCFKDDAGLERILEIPLGAVHWPDRREARMLDGQVLYLCFDTFNAASHRWLREQLRRSPSPAGIVLDLRFNRGGRVDALRRTLAEFMPAPVVLGTFITRTERTRVITGTWWLDLIERPLRVRTPLVVLVGNASFSGAEIFAEVIRENHRGIVVGTASRTWGKVLGSDEFPLPDGGRLQIAWKNFLTPGGKPLEDIGVKPDVVAPPLNATDLRSGIDTHVRAALAALAGPAQK